MQSTPDIIYSRPYGRGFPKSVAVGSATEGFPQILPAKAGARSIRRFGRITLSSYPPEAFAMGGHTRMVLFSACLLL
jgi:hypothetical protein